MLEKCKYIRVAYVEVEKVMVVVGKLNKTYYEKYPFEYFLKF